MSKKFATKATAVLAAAVVIGSSSAPAFADAVIMDKNSHTFVRQATGDLFTGSVEAMTIPGSAVAELAANGLAFNEAASVESTNREKAVVLVFDIVDPALLPTAALIADGSSPENISLGVVSSADTIQGLRNITTADLTPNIDFTPGITDAGASNTVVQGGQLIRNTFTGIKPTSSIVEGVVNPDAAAGSTTTVVSNYTGDLDKVLADTTQGGKYRGMSPATARDCGVVVCSVEATVVAEDSVREKRDMSIAPFNVSIKSTYGVRMDKVAAHGPDSPLEDYFGNTMFATPSRTIGTSTPGDAFFDPSVPLHPGQQAPVQMSERGVVLDPSVSVAADGTAVIDFPVDAASAGAAVLNPDGTLTMTRDVPGTGWDFANQYDYVIDADLAAGDTLSVWVDGEERLVSVVEVDATSITLSAPDGAALTFTSLTGGNTGAGTKISRLVELPAYDTNATWVKPDPAALDDYATISAGETAELNALGNDSPDKGFEVENLGLLAADGNRVQFLEVDGEGVWSVVDGDIHFAAAETSASFTATPVGYEWDQVATDAFGGPVDGGTASAVEYVEVVADTPVEVPAEPETPVEPEVPVEPELPVEPETPAEPPVVVPDPPVIEIPEVPVVDEPEVPVVEVPVEEPVVPSIIEDTSENFDAPPIEDGGDDIMTTAVIEDELADTGATKVGLFAGLGVMVAAVGALLIGRKNKKSDA